MCVWFFLSFAFRCWKCRFPFCMWMMQTTAIYLSFLTWRTSISNSFSFYCIWSNKQRLILCRGYKRGVEEEKKRTAVNSHLIYVYSTNWTARGMCCALYMPFHFKGHYSRERTEFYPNIFTCNTQLNSQLPKYGWH